MNARTQAGFSLIAAIFILVVLAGVTASMVGLNVNQQVTVVMGLQGARAMQAARAGLEYGVQRALYTGDCPPTDILAFQNSDQGLRGFQVLIQCDPSGPAVHVEKGKNVRVFKITALGSFGVYELGLNNTSPDYVSRQLQVTVSNAPPN